jgi:hypothetical protein
MEAAYTSLTKHTEELCGDHVEILHRSDSLIMVLSDGLGSGVKANILSTITGKIISTMMDGGATLEDTVETVANTLPVCSVRKVAYSTFSILKVTTDGKVCLTEFDSPACVFVRNGKLINIDYEIKNICGHNIRQSHFTVESGDLLVLMSDGAIYAGLGRYFPLGWGFQNAGKYISSLPYELNAKAISNKICRKCNDLYDSTPMDDTTVAAIKIEPIKTISLFSGPPVHPEDDKRAVCDFLSGEGKKVICGGSSAKIVSRIINEELNVSVNYVDPDIPPTATINGIDLVTEGVLTLNRTVELLKSYKGTNVIPNGKNAAEQLANMLITDCTNLNMFIGMKKNPAHTKNGLINDLGLRMLILNDMYKLMQQLGKTVTRKYY